MSKRNNEQSRISKFSSDALIMVFFKFGAGIVFALALAILAILSFVNDIQITSELRNASLIAFVSLILNYFVWETYYKVNYDKVLQSDLKNEKYCIHRRFYNARKGYSYKSLQENIKTFNKDFKLAWIADVEELTGRKEQDIVNEGYKKHTNKILIFRLKHKLYPKTGIKSPKDLLRVLSVGGSGKYQYDFKRSEKMHSGTRLMKLINSAIFIFLIASVAIDFITGNLYSALYKLLLNVAMLFCSLFTGSTLGIKSAKIKLSCAEDAAELMEQWKNLLKPTEEPFNEVKSSNEVVSSNENVVVKNDVIATEEIDKIDEPVQSHTIELT